MPDPIIQQPPSTGTDQLPNTQTAQKEGSPKVSATDILHFEKWLASLGERKATDLHLAVGTVPSLRVDGAIKPMMGEEVLTAERVERITEQLLSTEELELLHANKQLVVSKTLKKSMRFRIHFFYSRGFLGVSLRNLPNAFVPLAELPHANMLAPIISAQQGLYIIAGPFDSGRTSTVRSIISEINQTHERYIVTLESPIEYLIPSNKSVVVQREVGRDVTGFAEGIASLAEEDVDVLFLSALDDPKVLEDCLGLATAGRLVIVTMGGSNVVAVLEYLRDLAQAEDRERILHSLGDALIGISAQLLLQKIGGGRVLITSNMQATHPIKSLIREGKFDQIPNVMQTSREQGMVTTDKALVTAVQQGIISLADAKAHAVDINQFNSLASH